MALGGLLLLSGIPALAGAKEPVPWTLHYARYGAAVVSDGTALYVIGGGNSGFLSLGGIERVDLTTGQAAEMPVRVIPRRFHAAVLIGREIYIFGGEAEEGLIASIEAVSLDTWKVRTVGQMPTPRRALGAVKIENLVFTLGGSAPGDWENLPRATVMEAYDWEKNKWFRAPSMPEPKEVPAVLYEHSVYTLGGYNGTGRAVTSCERYDLTAGKWETLGPVPFTLSAYSAVNLGHAIVCFGDYEEQGRVAAYRPDHGTWSKLDVSFTPRRHSCACRVGEWVYVIGGNRASTGQASGVIERYSVSKLEAAIARAKN